MCSKNSRPSGRPCFEAALDRELLTINGLDGFDTIWSLEVPWVEEPNFRRRGWSGVGRLELRTSTQDSVGVYLKRQENHGYRSLLNPFRIRPTAFREYKRLTGMHAAAITAPDVLYYGERRIGGALQAILITREIPRSISFEGYMHLASARPSAEVRQVVQDTAALIGRLHRHHFQHCALYGKHVLISGFQADQTTSGLAAEKLVPYLIDVEKSRRRASRIAIGLRDLNQFYRHAPWTEALWDTFLDQYALAGRMERLKPLLAWLIQNKVRRKQARRQST